MSVLAIMAMTKYILMAFGLLATAAHAQQSGKKNWVGVTPPADSTKRDSLAAGSYFTLGTDYTSRVVFCGRDFGERQFGISPYLLFTSGKGFYAYTLHDFWSATPAKPARNVLGAGYELKLFKKLNVFVGYERWFNHYDDDYFDHAMQNELEIGLAYQLGKFSVEPVFYYYVGLEK